MSPESEFGLYALEQDSLEGRPAALSKTPVYRSTKTFDHSVGFSAAFRQWRAYSHCRFIHGYALSIRLVFATQELDGRNWTVDFGDFRSLKEVFKDHFDHKTLVAKDDPRLDYFRQGVELGVLDLIVVDNTGCEQFAKLVYQLTDRWLEEKGYKPRCWLESAEISEHGANSAIYSEVS